MPAAGWTVCIDFGTAFSKAAAARTGAWTSFDPSAVRPLAIGAAVSGRNPFLLESAVFVGDTHIAFGAMAVSQASAAAGAKRQALRSFKTLLGVADLDRALDAYVPRSIDPHRRFRQRDLIVLFLAYLMRAISVACAADPVLQGAELRFRFALPAWPGAAAAHGRVTALFGAAERVSLRLGDALFDPAGVPLAAAAEALEQAQGGAPLPMGMIFEAPAAAAYSLIGLEAAAAHLMVVDMGAGTTDFAALASKGARLDELATARLTLTHACDYLDHILLDLALHKTNLKTQAEQAKFWHSQIGSTRELKDSLFREGRAALVHQGKAVTIALRDLQRDRDYKALAKELKTAFDHALVEIAARAAKDGRKDVYVVPVGGGANLPLIQDMVHAAKAPRVRVRAYPVTPEWAHAPVFGGNLAPIFPQLAVAIGGALAPESLLAV